MIDYREIKFEEAIEHYLTHHGYSKADSKDFDRALLIMKIRGASLVAKFLLTLFIARFMGFEQLGLYGLITAATIWAPVVLGLGITYTLSRHAVTQTTGEVTAALRQYGRFLSAIYAVLLMAALIPYACANWTIRNTLIHHSMVTQGPLTWKAIQQYRAVKPKVPPGSSVVILNDPFHSFDELYIASLCLGDRSVMVHVQSVSHLPPEEIAPDDMEKRRERELPSAEVIA